MLQFAHIIVIHIARSLNSKADALAGIPATMAVPKGGHCEIFVKEKRLMPDLGTWDAIADCVSSNPMVTRVGIFPAGEDWRQPFINYLKYGILREDAKEKIGIRIRAPRLYLNEAFGLLR